MSLTLFYEIFFFTSDQWNRLLSDSILILHIFKTLSYYFVIINLIATYITLKIHAFKTYETHGNWKDF